MIAMPSPSDLERFVDLIWQPGDVREVRIPTPGRTDSGYFDSPAALVAAVSQIDGRENMYLTVNPVSPALLARAANRIRLRSRETTSDTQVLERRWLPIDIDPQRASGISSSEEEREAALAITRQVWTYLTGLGWPEPIVAMSGNGYWMLYPVALPNDDASKALVEGVLKHLSNRFTTDAVSIDMTVSNASRIVALFGTLKVKGDATPDRPHRRSGLLRTPVELVPVPAEKLAELAPVAVASEPAIVVAGDRMPEGWVAKLLDAAGVTYRTGNRKGNTWYKLDHCPFHPDDDIGGDCGVGEDSTGKALSKCLHNRGAGKTWQDFKAALGIVTGASTRVVQFPATSRELSPGMDAADLLDLDLRPLRWLVPDLVPEGTTILASEPKVGKSCLVYQIAVEAAIGGDLFGRRVTPGAVLYLALEDGKRRGQDRLRAALAGRTMPRGRLEVRWDANRIGAGLEDDIRAWLDKHPDAVMVAIDTLGKVRPGSDGRRNAYEVDVQALTGLQDLFRDRTVALVIVHHTHKAVTSDFLASVNGTYGLTGSADTIMVVRRKRAEAFGSIHVTGRDTADAEIPVRFDGHLWTAVPGSVTAGSMERSEVYQVIESHGPIYPKAIGDRLGMERTAVQHMVNRLVQGGAVARTVGGYVVARAVLETSDPSSIPHHSLHSNSGDSDGGQIGASEAGWLNPCRRYADHQSSHRYTPNGWTCDACYPEEGPTA